MLTFPRKLDVSGSCLHDLSFSPSTIILVSARLFPFSSILVSSSISCEHYLRKTGPKRGISILQPAELLLAFLLRFFLKVQI
jgi:hypothetical protein